MKINLSSSRIKNHLVTQLLQREVLKKIPSVEQLHQNLFLQKSICDRTLNLLHWILIGNPAKLKLSSISKSNFDKILDGAKDQPDFIFRVQNKRSQNWSEHQLHYGYHGSKCENIHSILNHGLQQHLNQNCLFGEGIYLSTDSRVSLGYAKPGSSWVKSSLGDKLGVVLLVKVKDDPNCVKLHKAHVPGSEGGEVPETYIIVRNNELVQTEYLLVYCHNKREEAVKKETNAIIKWMNEHKMWVILLAYVFVLIGVGVGNSPHFNRFLRKIGIYKY